MDARRLDVIGPVHLDIHVDDLKAALAKALEAGATQEHVSYDTQHGSVAFRSDPFSRASASSNGGQ